MFIIVLFIEHVTFQFLVEERVKELIRDLIPLQHFLCKVRNVAKAIVSSFFEKF